MSWTDQEILAYLHSLFPFQFLKPEELKSNLKNFELVNFSENQVLFDFHSDSDSFYIILSGEVTLYMQNHNEIKPLEILGKGDFVGEDALSKKKYRTKGICSLPAVVLRISKTKLDAIRLTSAPFDRSFTLVEKSYDLLLKLELPWRGTDEAVYLITRRHPFFFVSRIVTIGGTGLISFLVLLLLSFSSHGFSIFLFGLGIFSLLLGAALASWAALEWSNDYFFITRDRVAVQTKLIGFFDLQQESPITAILSTGLITSFWGRMIGFGSIAIRSYTGDIPFEKLPYPHLIHDLLESRRARSSIENQQIEKEEIRKTLEHRLDNKKVVKTVFRNHQEKFGSSTYKASPFFDMLARFFGLKSEEQGAIIYRTHWWILFKKTAIPFTLLVVIVFFVIGRVIGLFSTIPVSTAYVGAIVGAIVCFGWWMYKYIDWHNDVYMITGDQLIDVYRRPLGQEDMRTAPVKNIQKVEFKRKGIIGLVLNFGTVRIQIGNEELTFDNVYDPSAIQAEIFEHWQQYNKKVRKTERQKLADWIETYDEIKNEGHEDQPS